MLKPSARWPQPWTSTGNRDVQSSRIVVFLFLFLHVSTVEHWGDYLGVFFGSFSTSLCVSDVTDQACKITFTHMHVQQTKHNIKMVGIGGLCYLPGRGEFLTHHIAIYIPYIPLFSPFQHKLTSLQFHFTGSQIALLIKTLLLSKE